MTTSIQKWGNSQGIRIPKSILDELKWKENEDVMIMVQDNKLIIEKTEKRKNIKDLFKEYDEKYEPIEIDWGEPMGDEIW